MKRYLVVANQTLGEPALAQAIRACLSSRDCQFYLVVPATLVDGRSAEAEWSGRALASRRLAEAVVLWRSWGADVDGEVGDASPIVAVADALQHRPVEEIIVGTLPPGLSRWLPMGVPQRLERLFHLQVRHIVDVPARPESASRAGGG